jgi:TIR domain
MKKTAFISYSMDDSELYILSLISEYLVNNDFYINTSFSTASVGQNFEYQINNQIKNSDLFIGISSENGINSKWVHKEWEIAQNQGMNAIYIIENTITINNRFEQNNMVIRFDRQSPENSLVKLREMIEKQKNKKSNKALNWVVGGLLGIAIIKLLSDE